MKDKMRLVELARASIESFLKGNKLKVSDEVKREFSEKRASFVTLTKRGELRGCIGTIYPRRKLYEDVIENARAAAFNDPRFEPLKKEELNEIKIEVSILSLPKKFGIGREVVGNLDKNMGVIIFKDGRSATFLPQVWEEIPNKEKFMEFLSLKAGLGRDGWKDAEVWVYRVEKFKEKAKL